MSALVLGAIPVNSTLVLYAGISLLATFIGSVSQVILKKAAQKTYSSPIREYLNFPVVFAYALFVLTTFMCIFAYQVVPLSLGPVLEASSYLYITFFGAVVFKEKVTRKKIVALALIVGGIAVYSFGV